MDELESIYEGVPSETAADEVNNEVIDELVGEETPPAEEPTAEPEKKEGEPEAEPEGKAGDAELASEALEATKEVDPRVAELERQNAGLLRDLQEERSKRRQATEQKTPKEQPKGPQTAAEILAEIQQRDGLKDDDVLSIGQQREYEQRKAELAASQQQATTQAAQREDFERRAAASRAKMLDEYSAEKVGPALAYDFVTDAAKGHLTDADAKAIVESPEPAREVYERSLAYLKKIGQIYTAVNKTPTVQPEPEAKKPPGKKTKEPKQPSIPRGGGAEAILAAQEAFEADLNKTDEQLDAEIRELQTAGPAG